MMSRLVLVCAASAALLQPSILLAQTPAVFSPDGCEYSVTFPSEPSTYTAQITTTDDSLVPVQGAQLTLDKGSGLIRAECGYAGGTGLRQQFGSDDIAAYMVEISKSMGLSKPVYETTETNLGIVGTITGTKDSERGRITTRIINIVGDSSILTLTLASLSTDFQTPEMPPFVRSVKKR